MKFFNRVLPFQLAATLLLALIAPLRGQTVPTDHAAYRRGEAVFKSLCYTCHGLDGRGAEKYDAPGFLMGPPLVDSPRVAGHRDYVINVLLYGLTGPVDGTSYQEIMLPFSSNPDRWIADVATFIRGSFGPDLSPVTATDVARVRAAIGARTLWPLAELEPRIPKLVPLAQARLTANDPGEAAQKAIEPGGWQSAGPAHKDMWLQLELPAPARISEVEFTSSATDGFALLVSADGNKWTEAATGRRLLGWVNFKVAQPAPVRFAKVMITAAAPTTPVWSVGSLRVYSAPEK